MCCVSCPCRARSPPPPDACAVGPIGARRWRVGPLVEVYRFPCLRAFRVIACLMLPFIISTEQQISTELRESCTRGADGLVSWLCRLEFLSIEKQVKKSVSCSAETNMRDWREREREVHCSSVSMHGIIYIHGVKCTAIFIMCMIRFRAVNEDRKSVV